MKSPWIVTAFAAAVLVVFGPREARAQGALLDSTSGLVKSANPLSGLLGADAQTVQNYARAISGLEIATDYQADQSAPDSTLGPLTIVHGASVKLKASLSKHGNDAMARVDSFSLDMTGVKFGPSINVGPIHTGPLFALNSVSVDSQGRLSVKLNKWIPTITIDRIEHKTNGDIVLHGPWWLPPVTITKSGDVYVSAKVLGFQVFNKKIGHFDYDPFADWPPTALDFAAVVGFTGALEGLVGQDAATIEKRAGNLDWHLNAKLNGLPTGGSMASGNIQLDGQGRIEGGEVKTTGGDAANRVHVDLALPQGTMTSMGNSATLSSAGARFDGSYSLEVPLQPSAPGTPSKLKISTDGTGTISVTGNHAHLDLPAGTQVDLGGSFGIGGQGQVHASYGAGGPNVSVSGFNYAANVSGPITVTEKSGQSQSLSGDLVSKGTVNAGMGQGVSLKGGVWGNATTGSNLNVGGATIQKGAQVDLALGQVDATVTPDGKLGPVSVAGSAGVQATLGTVSKQIGPVAASLPGTQVALTVSGNGTLTPGQGVTGQAHVNGNVTLGNGANVAATLPGNGSVSQRAAASAVITESLAGSSVSISADVAKTTPSGNANVSGTVKGTLGGPFGLNDGPVTAQGSASVGVNGKFVGAVSPTGQVLVDPTQTSASVPVNVSLDKGTKVAGNIGGQPVSLTLGSSSSLGLTGQVGVDAQGKPVVKELDNVTILLSLSKDDIQALGLTATVPDGNQVKVTGKVVFGANGKVSVSGNTVINGNILGQPINLSFNF